MKNICLFSVLFFILSCSAPSAKNTLKFTKQDYIGEWPFSVNEIEVYCSGYKEIYGRTNDGKVYALNGSAKGAYLLMIRPSARLRRSGWMIRNGQG